MRGGLKPFFGINIPALVSNPILSRSRRLKPAAISSRRLFAAVCLSFSFLLLRLEMYAIGKLLLLSPGFKRLKQVSIAPVDVIENFRHTRICKRKDCVGAGHRW